MSVRNVLEDVISFWRDIAFSAKVIPRAYRLPEKPYEIVVISGVRRAGKTYLLFQLAQRLLESGVDENQIFYVNFEDERILPQTVFLTELIPTIRERFSHHAKLYLLLDEIHRIPNWSAWLNRQFERGHYLYISGSTTDLQPHKIAKILRGRTRTLTIYPLSFRETLLFKDIKIEEVPTEDHRSLLMGYLREYLKFGGFPEVVLLEDPNEKVAKLQEYFRAIMYRDIIEANNIENETLLEIILKILLDSTYFGSTKLYNTLKSMGIKTSKSTILAYKRAIESSYMLFQTEIFSYKIKDRMQYPKKVYCIDQGLRRSISVAYSKSESKALENAVFIEILRQINPATDAVFYYKAQRGYEVDFVILQNYKPKTLIQVAYELEQNVIRREERALLKAMDEFKLNKGYIIANIDYKQAKTIGTKKVYYVPIWEFFINSRKYLT